MHASDTKSFIGLTDLCMLTWKFVLSRSFFRMKISIASRKYFIVFIEFVLLSSEVALCTILYDFVATV